MQFLDGENSLCEKVIASLLNLELTLTTFLGSGFTKTKSYWPQQCSQEIP